MNRRLFLLGSVATLVIPHAAFANERTDQIIRDLTEHGYTRFEVSRTWLGRTRIVASSQTQTREVVFNARSGEILRDLETRLDRDDEDDSSSLQDDDVGDDETGGQDGDNGDRGNEGGGDEGGGGNDGADDGGDDGGDGGGDGGDDGGDGGGDGGGDND